jgi:hypothetical protein
MREQIAARRSAWIKSAIAAGITAGTLILGGTARAEKHHYPTAPDSFLMYQVDSTSELVEALKADPALRVRYARHFGIPQSSIVDFVKNALVPYRLPADRAITVYGVTKSGRIYPVPSRMAKGTKVWATRSGVPVLKWLCANPLTKTLPGTKLAKARSAKVKGNTKVAGAGALAPIAADTELPIATEPMLSLPPVMSTALTTPSVPVTLAPSIVPASTGPVVAKANYGLLFPVGLILLATLPHGGSGTGGAISPVLPPVPGGTAEAPEPGSAALMVAAGLPLLGLFYRRQIK